ncbi:DUF1223 domain-containing protein [Psychromonas sp. KJ10-10]|uniref:DUF1223 domain-containing protein n=1 Tax=Psychromonas sp. KJ10-10 TaxID=3391823 RepID=UPI0039B6AF1D
MKKIITTGLVAIAILSQPQVLAETFNSGADSVALVELFSSEGCSSCPPADKKLSALLDNPQLFRKFVPVAFHVDYWDRLGWADPFATPEYTARQYSLLTGGNHRSVYTPNFIISGNEWKGFFTGHSIEGAVDSLAKSAIGNLKIDYQASDSQHKVKAIFSPDEGFIADKNETLVLSVAPLGMGLKTDVRRGENRNKQLQHEFVALDWQKIAMTYENNQWVATLNLSKDAHKEQAQAISAWVSNEHSLIPIQAVGGFIK